MQPCCANIGGVTEFQRARSAEAKQLREEAILEAAAGLGARSGIREVTLTDIAHEVGMHKAQAPLNLERNVSLESVRTFKLATLEEVEAIGAELTRLFGLGEQERVDVIATATSLAGALWQMATPGPLVQELYRSDPRLAHAIVEIGPRLTRVLTAQLTGLIQSP